MYKARASTLLPQADGVPVIIGGVIIGGELHRGDTAAPCFCFISSFSRMSRMRLQAAHHMDTVSAVEATQLM